MKKIICQLLFVVILGSSLVLAEETRSIYARNCANCHGADGRGNTALGRALKLRDLRSPEIQKLSEHELVAILSKGADRGKMPSFEKKLGAEAVRKLATYVREIDLQPPTIPETKKKANSASSEPADVKSLYSAKCSHCHGADGSGNTVLGRTLKLVDMRSPEAQKFSDSELISIIASGMDRGRMPGFQKKLDPEMIQQLASYVRLLTGKPPFAATAKAISPQTPGEPVPPESVKPAAQAEGQALSTVRPEKQVQPPGDKPAVQTTTTSTWARLTSAIIPGSRGGARTELVDLNSASEETLMTLPGITEADALSIIGGRPYKSTLQFKSRNIIAPEKYAQIASRVAAKQSTGTARPSTASERAPEALGGPAGGPFPY